MVLPSSVPRRGAIERYFFVSTGVPNGSRTVWSERLSVLWLLVMICAIHSPPKVHRWISRRLLDLTSIRGNRRRIAGREKSTLVDHARFRRFGSRAGSVANQGDECGSRTRERAVAAIYDSQFARDIHIRNGNQFYLAGLHFVLRKAFADQRDAEALGYELFDHSDARELHGDPHVRSIGAELLVEHLAREAGLRKDQRLARDIGGRYGFRSSERIRGGDHQHQTVSKNRMHSEAWGFNGNGDNADIHRAVFHLFKNFVAEVPVDTDLHGGISPAVFRENIGQHIQAGGLVGAHGERAARRGGLIGNGTKRLIPQREQPVRVFEQRLASHRKPNGFANAIEKLLSVFLFELADLGADSRLRAVEFLSGAREAALLRDFQESYEVVKVHAIVQRL